MINFLSSSDEMIGKSVDFYRRIVYNIIIAQHRITMNYMRLSAKDVSILYKVDSEVNICL